MDAPRPLTIDDTPAHGGGLRVLMTTDAIGGAWACTLELCRSLGPLGVEVVLAPMGRQPSLAQRVQVAALENVTLFTSSYQLEWMIDPWRDVAAAGRWLSALADDMRVDMVHLGGYVHAALPWRVPVVVTAYSCVFGWWNAVRGHDPPPHWRRYRERVCAGIHSADSVVAPTLAAVEEVQRHYGSLRDARAIYCGKIRGPFAPSPKNAVILASGAMWDQAKNVAALDDVAPRLPWPVWLSGPVTRSDGRRYEPLHMRSLGPMAPLGFAEELGRAAIYALPARYEPYGFSLLEAAESGCALVLGDIPSLRELWDDAALFVPPDDRDALHGALTALIENDGLRRHLARKAWLRAQSYEPARMGAAYTALYRELIQRKSETRVAASW